MGELRAAVDGCEVVVRFTDGEDLNPALREALAELAEAMYEQQIGEAEVQGFGLQIGDLGLRDMAPVAKSAASCWGYTEGGHCTWYSGEAGPTSCTIHSRESK